MTSEILKVKKRFNYPPDLEYTPLVIFFNLRNSKILVFGSKLSKCWPGTQKDKKSWLFSFGKRQFVNCMKFNVGFIMNMLPKKEKKGWVFLFCKKLRHTIKCLQKMKTSETLKNHEGARHCRKPLGRRKGFNIFTTLGLTKIKAFL